MFSFIGRWRAAAAGVAVAIAAAWQIGPRVLGLPAAEKRVTFSILEDYDKGDDLGEAAKDFALFRELGVTTWRGSFGWDDYEPARGTYDFAWLHAFADLAAKDGIGLRPYIGYTPAWAAAGGTDKDTWNDPPGRPDDWTAFVRALSSEMRRHPNILSYEIYNEENVSQWWDGPAGTYTAVLDRASRAIKDVSPGMPVVLGGLVYPDPMWMLQVCGEESDAKRFDVVPFHDYAETWTPADVDLEHYLGPHFGDGFLETVDRDCGPKPIWVNEAGFATTPGRTEQDQADWWTRAIALFAAEPRIEHIGISEIKDQRADTHAIGGSSANYHLGITNADRSKKLAFYTLKDLVHLLDTPFSVDAVDVVAGSRDTQSTYARALRRHDGREIVFAWTKKSHSAVDIRLRQRGTVALEHRFDGTTERYAGFDGRTLAHVGLEPGHARTFEILP